MSEQIEDISPFMKLSHPLPFHQFSAEDIVPNITQLLNEARHELQKIESVKDVNYENVLSALDRLGENLESALTVYSQLKSLLGTPEIRQAMQEVQPQVSSFYATIPFSQPLYQKLKQISASEEANQLSPPQKRYLSETLLSFQRNGAEVDEASKQRLEWIESRLAEVTMNFAKNVVEETDAFEWVTSNKEDLKGLPASALASAAHSAKSKGKDGWRFTLQGPSYISMMTYCDNRSLREHFYKAHSTRASTGEKNNEPLIHEILSLRQEKASLLGYNDVSDLYLASRMVKNGSNAKSFVDDLVERTKIFAEREHRELQDFAQQSLGWTKQIEAWDLAYLSEKLKKETCGFDQEQIKPYLEVNSVMTGMFEIVERLYQVKVVPIAHISKWHEDVMTFALIEKDKEIGIFYADLFPREGKQGGAWMCPLLYKSEEQPHVGLICANFTPPVDGRSLITHREVETLFHEFGHLLHHLLTTVKINAQAGTNVAWDFVELPSQIMENWCWEKEALNLFAKHYETEELIPNDLFEQLKNTQTFRMATGQMRQLCFADIDLILHRHYNRDKDGPVLAFAQQEMQKLNPTSLFDDYAMIAGFTHLFASSTGYAAGYYSYKWAEVLDADAFTRFKKEGLFSPLVGQAFRELILSKGDSEDPSILFERFMGRPPSSEALFQRLGLQS